MSRSMKVALVFFVLLISAGGAWFAMAHTPPAKDHAGDYVVLLHGLGRTGISMKQIEWRLRAQGYEVINLTYPSTEATVTNLVLWLEGTVQAHCRDRSRKIHFVTHSFGGILARAFLKEKRDINLGRVVMLAPPNGGSEIVDRLKTWGISEGAVGPSGMDLGTGTNDLPRRLGPADFELGVIAGDRSLNPLYSHYVEGVDDGKISVENAKVAGMRDFLVVHHSHTFIMWRKAVIEQIIHFLHLGRFKRQGADREACAKKGGPIG